MTDMDIGFFLGGPPGTDYGDYVQQVDIWQENLNGVGTWEVIADPDAVPNPFHGYVPLSYTV
jgi:hypothetical protein